MTTTTLPAGLHASRLIKRGAAGHSGPLGRHPGRRWSDRWTSTCRLTSEPSCRFWRRSSVSIPILPSGPGCPAEAEGSAGRSANSSAGPTTCSCAAAFPRRSPSPMRLQSDPTRCRRTAAAVDRGRELRRRSQHCWTPGALPAVAARCRRRGSRPHCLADHRDRQHRNQPPADLRRAGGDNLIKHHIGGLVAFALGLGLTSGSLRLLSHSDPDAGRAVELWVLLLANAVSTLIRFLALRRIMRD
jgi:hypothetical protein